MGTRGPAVGLVAWRAAGEKFLSPEYHQVPAELAARAAGQERPPEGCLKVGTRGPAVRLVAPGGPRRWSPGGGARRPGRDPRWWSLVLPGAPWPALVVQRPGFGGLGPALGVRGGPRRWSPVGGARRPGRDLRGPPLVVPGGPWRSPGPVFGAWRRPWGSAGVRDGTIACGAARRFQRYQARARGPKGG